MITAKTNVSSLDTLSWKSCDVKRHINAYTTTTRLISTIVVISLTARPENINPPTITKMTVDGLKGRKRSCSVEYNKYVCTVNLVNVNINFVKERDCHGKHAYMMWCNQNRLLGDYFSTSEIFNIFIESSIQASASKIDLYLRDSLDEVLLVFVFNNVRSAPRDKLHSHSNFS